MVSEYLQLLLRDLSYLYCPISLGISNLAAGSSTISPLVWRLYLWGLLLVPQFPLKTGVNKFLEGLIHSVLGYLLPAFFVSLRRSSPRSN